MNLILEQKIALMYTIFAHDLINDCTFDDIVNYCRNEPVCLCKDTFIKLYYIDKTIDWLYEHIDDKLDMVFVRSLYSQYKTLTVVMPNPNLSLPMSCYAPELNIWLSEIRDGDPIIQSKFVEAFCQHNNLFGEDAKIIDYMIKLKVFNNTDEKLATLVNFYKEQFEHRNLDYLSNL